MNNFDPTELEIALLPLANINTECFELSWVLHEAITRTGYIVSGHYGYVQATAGDIVTPHFWLWPLASNRQSQSQCWPVANSGL